ncbi:MAG: hypothetical protein WCJ01_04345 [Ignavibacteria bacterium]
MKKTAKAKTRKSPAIFVAFFFAFIVGSIVLLYVGLKLEIERLTKEKVLLKEFLEVQMNKTTMLLVEIQKLETEERIVQFAETNLEMIKFIEPNNIIEIDRSKFDQITKIINSKYE